DNCGGSMLVPLFCDGCGADYPERRGMSAFAILSLPPVFPLEAGILDRIEADITSRLHPDRWQHKGENNHFKALLAQSAVNEALKAVRGPFHRAETLLGLLNKTECNSEETRPRLPTEFLVEQLEIQEEIETGLSPERKRLLQAQVRDELGSLEEALHSGFAKLNSDDEASKTWTTTVAGLQETIDRARYWRNVRSSLRSPGPR
ncbi:MAG: iron-sulfur cluster co-chaperone HscB C-terminal domain-containing protein, partial [Myxococcota bacterium]|nr:iron-sulfur cluster co-chaperone HscB C-terminal domain-containing protein [Myxococcota bacterium]